MKSVFKVSVSVLNMMKCIIFATLMTCAWATSLDDFLSSHKQQINEINQSIENHVLHMNKTTAANILLKQNGVFFSKIVHFSEKICLEAQNISPQFKLFADNIRDMLPDFIYIIHYNDDDADLSADKLLEYFVEASQFLVNIAYSIADFIKENAADNSREFGDYLEEFLKIALEANKNLDKELEYISCVSSSNGNS